jgi:hypothetical protein
MQELMLLMKEQCDCEVSNLFLGVLCCRNEIDGLEMTKIDIESVYVYVQQLLTLAAGTRNNGRLRTYLADVLFPRISIQFAI